MNVYTSDAVDFFALVLSSGAIALAVLAVVSAFAFTIAFGLFRTPAAARAVRPVFVGEVSPQRAFEPEFVTAPARIIKAPAVAAG